MEKIIAARKTRMTETAKPASTDYEGIWSGGWDDMRRYGP